MNINIILQARYGSSRLPGKIFKKLSGKYVIEHVVNRLKKCQKINNIIVATTTNKEDDIIANFCKNNNIIFYRGDENNVLDRYYNTALISNTDIIVRATCDCPLIDYKLIDEMIDIFLEKKIQHYRVKYYNGEYAFPDGFENAGIFTFKALEDAYKNAKTNYEKEHVQPYIIKNYETIEHEIIFKKKYSNLDFDNLHLSLDTQKDYILLENIFKNVYEKNNNFDMHDVLDYLNNNTHLLVNDISNLNVFDGAGQKLYIQAKKIIPGGTQLLSKRPEMFLPNAWPAYYQKASGFEITTLDGIKFKDFSYMGIGSCILGYKDVDVNREVHSSIDMGNMCTLNTPKEVVLTNMLLKLHPWADMARYTRSAGEACAMAIRIARASCKKDKVAFCGYHGWHDWYLASNWNEGNDLSTHLLKGLSPVGVPQNLKNTAFPFKYNKINELLSILEKHDIGTIIMEPQRGEKPKNNFLKNIRNLCDEKNIILIFDEVTSAFRTNTGGIHLKLDVTPDMTIFGKAMSNGYPIASVIGKKKYMSAAEDSFISSTFWTEDIGYAAAIATITKHQKMNVGEHIQKLGMYFQEKLHDVGIKTGIDIDINGLPSLTSWNFKYDNSLEVKTLFIQKMLKRYILAKNSLYLSYSHKKKDIDYYLSNINDVFNELKEAIDNNNVSSQLIGPIVHNGFTRLT